MIGYRKTPLMTPSWGEEIISTKTRWKSVFVCIFLSFGLFMLLCVPPPGPTQYIFHTPMARCSLYVLKVPLNTKQANKQTLSIDILMEICLLLTTLFLCQTVGWDPTKPSCPHRAYPSEFDRSMSNGLNAYSRSLKQIDRPFLHLIDYDSEKKCIKKTFRGDANIARWPDPQTTNTQTNTQTDRGDYNTLRSLTSSVNRTKIFLQQLPM